MKVSKNILLAAMSVALSTSAWATAATAPAPAVKKAVHHKKVVRHHAVRKAYVAPVKVEPVVAVKETSGTRVVRNTNDLNVNIIGEVTGIMINPMVKANAKEQNGGVKNGAVFGVDETGIGVLVAGHTTNWSGFDYGAKVTLTMDKYGVAGSTVLKDSYLNFGNADKWGTLYIGNLKGAEYRTVNTVTPILGGLGSFMYNNWGDFVNLSSGIEDATLTMQSSTSRAAKIMWTSPRIAGFMLLLSYAPNSSLQSLAGGGAKQNSPLASTATRAIINTVATNDPTNPLMSTYHTDNLAAGINYRKAFDNGFSVDGGFALLSSGTRARNASLNNGSGSDYETRKLSIYRRVLTYTLGVMGAYRGAELGVQWINNGKSGQARQWGDRTAGQGIATSAAYNFGVHKVAVGYYYFVRKLGTTPSLTTGGANWAPYDNTGVITTLTELRNTNLGKAKLNGVTAVYTQKVADGLTGFVEYGVMRMRTSENQYKIAKAQYSGGNAGSSGKAVPSTTAQAILTGVSLNF